MRAQIRKKKQDTFQSLAKEQIKSINSQLRSQIRERQKQAIFSNIRRQFASQNRNMSQQNMEMHEIEQQLTCLDPDQHPLSSRLLQKYSSVPHSEMWKYLEQISQHLIDNNVYLSVLLDESTHENSEENQIIQDDQQTLLVNDLFYLTLEHYDRFKFPRKFKFVRNGSRLVASFISMVSTVIMPQQLSYWIQFMNEEDRALVYLGIIGSEDEGKNIHLHYQSWVNHPILRNNLLSDIKMESAAKAIRQIIGFKQVHPDRLKNNQGLSLYQLLCKLLYEQLQGMRQVSEDRSQRCQVISQHMEICLKVIEAHLLTGLDADQLFRLVDKIMVKRVQSEIQLISPLFCIWVIDSLINNDIHVLSKIGYQILVSMISYDPNKLLRFSNSGMVIKQEKLNKFYEKLKFDYPTIGSNQQKDQQSDDNDF